VKTGAIAGQGVQTGEVEGKGGAYMNSGRTRRCIHEQWQDEEAQTGVVEGLAGRDRSFRIL
jgi:hypothetical protein